MKMFLFFLKTLLYGWVVALIELLQILCRLLKRWFGRGHRGKIPSPHRCVPINDPAFVRPDPTIYDQYYLTGLGLAVTWDNPDIQLYLNGTPVSSNQLLAGTTYEVVAQIWNNSTDAPVVGMRVAFSFLEFGVGTTSVPIGSTQIDLRREGRCKLSRLCLDAMDHAHHAGPLLPSGPAATGRRHQHAEQSGSGKYRRWDGAFAGGFYLHAA
jgi:hypothetical protein